MSREPELRWTVPYSWVWTKLSGLGDIVAGGTPSTKEATYWAEEINWISPADLTGYSAKTIKRGTKSISRIGLANSSAKVMPAGSVHFSTRAPIGYIVISSEPLATNQGFKSLVPAPSIFNEYVYYYLMASREYAHKCASGTTFLELSGRAFGDLPIPLAPTTTQHKIVAKIEELFSELDKGVESLKTARAKLNVYRQAVLKHAFEGKLTAQWREENKNKLETPEQLLARIKQERETCYERQLKERKAAIKEWEEVGKSGRKPQKPQKPKNPLPIAVSPVHNLFWTRLFLDELAVEAVLGKMLDKEKNTGTSRYYLGNINLRWGKFDLENLKTMKVEESEIERYRLAKGDLVICEGGEPGRCAVWEGQEPTMLIQKALHRVRFTEGYSPYFAFYFMTYAARSGLLSPNFTGSTIKHLTGKGLGNVLFPLCTLAEQEQIVRYLDSTVALCDELDCQIDNQLLRANALRQSILRKAFTGQLVPQDPHDEPASILLDRIRAEREKAVNSNHSKKTKKRKTTA